MVRYTKLCSWSRTQAQRRRALGLHVAMSVALLAAVYACGPSASDAGLEAGSDYGVVPVSTLDGAALGSVALQTACSDGANQLVRRGLALLHHMTYEEAASAFQEATAEDPECAIGYWGVAMTYVHPLWPDVISEERIERGTELLAKAREATSRAETDDDYVAALGGYYEEASGRSEQERLVAFAEGWKRAHEAHPHDPEATAFYALSLLATAPADKSYPAQRQAGELMAGLLARIPDHPGGNHYTIHAYDFPPLAERALGVARKYGRVAPSNAHALHMTSHIFTRLGLWGESIEFNERSAEAAWNSPVGGAVSHHHLHALDYLAYAYLQQGNDERAVGVSEHLTAISGPMYNHAATAYAVAAVPARVALERRRWDEAARLSSRSTQAVPWDQYPHLEALSVFARALGAARVGETEVAEADIQRLEELRDRSKDVPGSYDWGTQVEILRMSALAWTRLARGDLDEALELAMAAADLEDSTNKNPVTPGVLLPSRELYADMLMEAGRYAEAVRAYEASLVNAPNRLRSLHGAGRAGELAGEPEIARRYYENVIQVAAGSERPEVLEARGYLSTAGS